MAGQALYQANRIGPALKTGYDQFAWVRKSYGFMAREYGGRHYGQSSDGIKRPVNLLNQFVDTIIPNLLNQRPKIIGRSKIAQLRGEAELVALGLDLLWKDMDLVDRTHQIILDALLSPIAVAKFGLRAGADIVKIGERGHMLGQPYMARVSPDDFVADPAARTLEEVCWQAHRYRVPRIYALESGIYDPAAIEKLTPLGRGDRSDERSDVEQLSAGKDKERFAAQEYIELWDVAIRNEDQWLIGTLAGMKGGDVEPMWVNIDGEPFEFDGSDSGPYEILTFHRMPDNLPGVSPAMSWLDLHEATYKLYRKMIGQAMRAKKNAVYTRSAKDDALTLKEAEDGEMIAVDNAEGIKEIETGGVQEQGFVMLQSMQTQWNVAAGNPELLSGAGVQSDKATGQQILQANASTRLAFMKDKVWRFTNAIHKHLAGYLMSDPLISLPLPYRIEGGEYVDVVYDSATRRGDSRQLVFETELSSMVGSDPAIALKRKIEGLNVLAQFVPMAGAINLQALARQIGREIGWDDIDEIINDMERQAMLMGAIPPNGMAQPAGMYGAPRPDGQMGAGPRQGVGGGPNERAGMVRGAYGVGAEMQGAMA